ncbi:MAG: precorrin-3B C(17)-methyltransferase [Dehalococcoidia bacterium]|nr:precorrin-3B C(17)-methyltransferase [Dehalococcoidia bacterium]
MTGTVYLIGLGPGGVAYLTPEARNSLKGVDVVIGHASNLRQVGRLVRDKEIHALERNPLERACLAATRAGEGHNVAIVSLGHPGIYAIASTFFSYLKENGLDIPVVVVPGLTLGDYVAAKLGSPLGADHAVISLADRAGHWRDIKARLVAALVADLVIVIYNPRGKLGASRLQHVITLALLVRPGETPVGLVTDAASLREKVSVSPLAMLNSRDIKANTLLVIGSRASFIYRGKMITPRTYRLGVGY